MTTKSARREHRRTRQSDPNFRLRLELALLRKGINQSELSRLMGRHRATVSHWMSGRFEPPRSAIPKLAETLGVSTDWLQGVQVEEQQLATERAILQLMIAVERRGLTDSLLKVDADLVAAALEKLIPSAGPEKKSTKKTKH